MRKTAALAASAILAATLAGCAQSEAQSCQPQFPAGDAATIVTASGRIGVQPNVRFPTPLVTDGDQVSVLEPGEGDVLSPGEVADLQLSLYVGESGELLTASTYEENNSIRRVVGDEDDVIGKAVQCAQVGSRVALTTTVEGIYGPDTLDPRLGLENDDTLVMVIDVEDSFPGRANGVPQLAENGMPAVVLAPDGRPGISVPAQDPPSELRISVLRQGDGPAVEQGDVAVVHYTGLTWDDQHVFDSSWDRGVPVDFEAISMADTDQGGLVPGFADALIGQNVGSQVLVVIPPEFGYPEGQSPAGISEGSTMVFVFDILGIQ